MSTEIDDSGLAFPFIPPSEPRPYKKGMSLREYAAIKLRVPDSGRGWLDDMIRKAAVNDIVNSLLKGGAAADLPVTTIVKNAHMIMRAVERIKE